MWFLQISDVIQKINTALHKQELHFTRAQNQKDGKDMKAWNGFVLCEVC